MEPKDWSDTGPATLSQPRDSVAVDVCRDIIEDLPRLVETAFDHAKNGIEPDFTDLDIEILKMKRAVLRVWHERR